MPDLHQSILAPTFKLTRCFNPVNFRLTNFFAGAGLTKFFELGDDFWANKFSLKVHGGLKLIGIKLRIYMIIPFDDLFRPAIYGGTVGFGF